MATFYRYTALKRDPITGLEHVVRDSLVTSGDIYAEIRASGMRPARAWPVHWRMPLMPWEQLQASDLTQFYDQMGMLVHLTPVRAIEVCAEQSGGNMKRILESVAARLRRGGTTLEAALARHRQFPEEDLVVIGAVRNQEAATRREAWETLKDRTENQVRIDRMSSKVRNDILTMVGANLFSLWTLGKTAPPIERLTSEIAGHTIAEPPVTTWTLNAVAWFVGAPGITLAVLGCLAVVAITTLLHLNPEAGIRYERLRWKLPYFGRALRAIETAKLARAFGAVYKSVDAATGLERIKFVSKRRLMVATITEIIARLKGRTARGRTDLETAFTHWVIDPMLPNYLVSARGGAEIVQKACRTVGQALERFYFLRMQRWLDDFGPLVGLALLLINLVGGMAILQPLFAATTAATHAYNQTYYIPTSQH